MMITGSCNHFATVTCSKPWGMMKTQGYLFVKKYI